MLRPTNALCVILIELLELRMVADGCAGLLTRCAASTVVNGCG
jgi:hypothetical protein